MSRVKTKPDTFYLVQKTEDGGRILKMHWDSTYELDAVYEVHHGQCTCRGFAYRRDCKHLQLVGSPETPGISLAEARAKVTEMIHKLHRDFHSVTLPVEPYERNEKREVVKITLELSKPVCDSIVFLDGVWEGVIEGVTFRFIVDKENAHGAR